MMPKVEGGYRRYTMVKGYLFLAPFALFQGEGLLTTFRAIPLVWKRMFDPNAGYMELSVISIFKRM